MYLKEATYFKYGYDGSINNLSSFVIPIEIACMLPKNEDINGCYMSSMIPQMNCANKWLRGPMDIKGARGICTPNEFIGKLRAYTHDVFKNASFTNYTSDGKLLYKMAITGSAMTACAIKNPREADFYTFEDYLECFYPMPKKNKNMINNKNESNQLAQLVQSYQSNVKNTLFEEISDESSKSTSIEENNDNDNNDNNNDDNNNDNNNNNNDNDNSEESEDSDTTKSTSRIADIDLAVECAFDDFDKSVELIFAEIKINNPYAVLCKKKTENKHKYIVKGIPRYIDIFHVASISHVVSKFHLDCVRAWFDGITIHCFPTFICAANTSMCSDIRWVSNQKDLRDVIMKYHYRGFGTYINATDLSNLQTYLNPTNGYPDTGFKYGMSGWKRKRLMRFPVYGTTSYFGHNYSKKEYKYKKMPMLIQNEVLLPYL